MPVKMEGDPCHMNGQIHASLPKLCSRSTGVEAVLDSSASCCVDDSHISRLLTFRRIESSTYFIDDVSSDGVSARRPMGVRGWMCKISGTRLDEAAMRDSATTMS